MARIRIEDLPVLEELGRQQMKGIFGGTIRVAPVTRILFDPRSSGRGDLADNAGNSAGTAPGGLPGPGHIRELGDEVWAVVEERLCEVLDEGSSD